MSAFLNGHACQSVWPPPLWCWLPPFPSDTSLGALISAIGPRFLKAILDTKSHKVTAERWKGV